MFKHGDIVVVPDGRTGKVLVSRILSRTNSDVEYECMFMQVIFVDGGYDLTDENVSQVRLATKQERFLYEMKIE
ncbi:MAG TPA: hypothetical protein VMV86_05245 [Methanosarcinales archaeon]|nr:hypothetical protein [Methanosarcinales archaeon]